MGVIVALADLRIATERSARRIRPPAGRRSWGAPPRFLISSTRWNWRADGRPRTGWPISTWMAKADPARSDAHVASAYSALEAVRASLPLRDPDRGIFQIRERGVFEAQIGALLRREPDEEPLAPGRKRGPVDQGPARLATAQNILENFRQAEVNDAWVVSA